MPSRHDICLVLACGLLGWAVPAFLITGVYWSPWSQATSVALSMIGSILGITVKRWRG